MSLQFLGGATGDGGSPRLYQEGDDFLVQGYTVTETQLLAELNIPDGETVVRVPQSLWKYLPDRLRMNQRTEEGRRRGEQMPVRLGQDARHRELRELYAAVAEEEEEEEEAAAAAWPPEACDPAGREAYRRQWLGLMSATVGRPGSPLIASAEQVSRVLRRGSSALMMPVTELRVIDGTRLVNHFGSDGTWVGSEMIDGTALAHQCSAAFDDVWALSAPHVRRGPA